MSLNSLFYTTTMDIRSKEVVLMSDHTEDVTQQVENQMNQVGNYAKQKAGRAASKIARKAGKVALKVGKTAAVKGGALAVKGITAFIAAIISLGVPLLIFLGVLFLLVGIGYLAEIESRPVNQNIQSESSQQMNKQESSAEKPQGNVSELSSYNLVVNAFYMNYASKSYYQFYEGKLHELGEPATIVPSATRANGDPILAEYSEELRDSSNLESQFLLSHELLWQLDEYLHDKKFKYPESFLKPLYHEEIKTGDQTTFKLKDLTNDKGELVAESNVYDENGNRTNEKTEGVWDYGLAPIISYKTYLEDSRYEYDVMGKAYSYSYTLPDGAVLAEGQDATFTGRETVLLTESDARNYKKDDEYLDYKFVHMIDQVLTFVGTFTPQIDYNWSRNPQAVDTFVESEVDKEKTKEYDITFEKMVPKTTSQGRRFKSVMVGKKKVAEVVEGCYRIDRNDPDYKYVLYQTCGEKGLLAQSDLPFTFKDVLVKKTVTEPVKVTVTEEVTYNKYLAEVKPQYRGEPQVSDFKGGRYLKDYMYYYETYVPETVLSDLDLSNRVTQDPEKLQEIIDSYQSLQSTGGSLNSGEGKEVGAFSQGAYDNAYRYLDLFKKYGAMYGVDPYLLLAKAAQESSGDHESNLTGNAAIGLMQIERPGRTDGTGVSQATAYNHQTKKSETVKVCLGNSNTPSGCLNVYNLEENIRVGAMQLAQRYERFNGHHMLALQSYNFGEGGIKKTVEVCGFNIDQVKQDQYDLDWMSCRQTVHDNPTLISPKWEYPTFGDPVYIENVLKFYNNPETNNHLVYTDKNGNTHRFDTSKINVEGGGGALFSSTGSGSSSNGGLFSSIGNFFKHHFSKITSSLASFFTDIPEQFGLPEKDTKHYDIKLTPFELKTMETMIFAMKEQVNMDQIGEVTDEMWKERYSEVFVNHSSLSHQLGTAYSGDLDPYFNGTARTPLPLEMSPTFLYGYRSMIQGSHNYGVALIASPGTQIHAIYDGTILSVEDEGGFKGYSIKVQHVNGLVSHYSNLDKSSIKVKEGDVVRKGDVIGSVAASKNVSQQFFHFELRENDIPVNPTFLFENPGGGDYYVPPTSGDFTIPLLKGYVSCEWACYSGHVGIDLGNYGDTTTPVIAAADGTVQEIRLDDGTRKGYGNAVFIDHNINGQIFRTVYGHLHSKPLVKEGDIVKQGQKLGTMGNTGNSNGAHLHFEIREGTAYSATVNPRKYINFPALRVPW